MSKPKTKNITITNDGYLVKNLKGLAMLLGYLSDEERDTVSTMEKIVRQAIQEKMERNGDE